MNQIGVEQKEVRYYPNGALAIPVLGFTSSWEDGQVGLWGLEAKYNDDLSSKPGSYEDLRDQRGQRVPDTRQETVSPKYGSDLVLTLDADVQALAESALCGLSETQAKGGVIVVTEPSTGNVLALASLPGPDLSNFDYNRDKDKLFSRSTALSYEPGSVMKVFTIATALEDGAINSNAVLHVTRGPLRIGGWPVPDDDYPPEDYMSLRDVVVHSSNRGAALVALGLGHERLIAGLEKFGFGTRTQLNMPGEPMGNLKQTMNPFPQIDLADMGFGHGITGSPLQVAQGIGVFANDGVLVPLRLLEGKRDPVTGELTESPQSQPTRVFGEATSNIMRDFMIGVVEEGTAIPAKTAWICAGKTGTAEKIENGHYVNKYYSTFAGYGPVPNPKWVIVVILDDPSGGNYFGGSTAGPIYKSLFTALMVREGIKPERDPDLKAPATVWAGSTQVADAAYVPDVTPALTDGGDKGYVLTLNPFGKPNLDMN